MTVILFNLLSGSSPRPIDAESIMHHFLSRGYSRHQAAGCVGNAVKRGFISVAGKVYCPSRNKMVNIFI